MIDSDAKRARAPRGSGPVTKAFLTALEAVPDTSRAAVAKAAMAMIRDELKTYPVAKKSTATKAKSATAKVRKAAGKTKAASASPAMKKRRGRKMGAANHAL